DDERDEDVELARRLVQPREPIARRRSRDAEHFEDLGIRFDASLEPADAPENEAGRETDLGRDEGEAEGQRAVPLPAVQRHDHVDACGDERADAREPRNDLHRFDPRSWTVTCPVSPLTTTVAPSGRSSNAFAWPTTVATPDSRARIARCDSTEPVSATIPLSRESSGAMPGVSVVVTSTEPGGGFSASCVTGPVATPPPP